MRIVLPAAATLLLTLSACSQNAPDTSAPSDGPQPGDATAPANASAGEEPAGQPGTDLPSNITPPNLLPPIALPVESIAGRWRLSSIDGETVPAAARTIFDIGCDRVEFGNCQLVAWNYQLAYGDLTLSRTEAITIDIAPKPLPCAAPFPPPVARAVGILDNARRVNRAGNGSITISSESGRMMLEPVS
ncbi:hypothetical protein [Aurantiacibacter marinus]|uniref:DUF306 domain-containing protein n=1 Tax=Aurantiacibacter marinus TaxID=874156 RepID=A0A0H0XSH2_9SPHN|nr:hypothetical protein [Aurantiacibacter marinus]KLI64936.1 hypothetical protein AAV99_05430 [Aurantiacibacter marinus]